MIYYLKDGNKIQKGLFGWISKIKDRMYRTITPRGYHIGQAAKEFIKGDTRDMSKFTPLENEVWARYLGTKYEGSSNLEPAIYRPTKGGATYDDVVKLKDESYILSDNVLNLLLDNYKKTGKKSMLVKGNETGLGTYTISMGEDEKGKYISYYDDWDINPTRGISAKYNIPILNLIGDIVPGTHPFSVYGRRYYKNGGKMNAIEQFKQGSKIHIKKKNRGKFTAYCGGNVTSACIAKAKASGNPTLVKRATFAANARKWKHQLGGVLDKISDAYLKLSDSPIASTIYDTVNAGLYLAAPFTGGATLVPAMAMTGLLAGGATANALKKGLNILNGLDIASAIPGFGLTEKAVKASMKPVMRMVGKTTKKISRATKYKPINDKILVTAPDGRIFNFGKYRPTYWQMASWDKKYAPYAALVYGEDALNHGLNVYQVVKDVKQRKKGGKLCLTPRN